MFIDLFYAASLLFENESTKRLAHVGVRIHNKYPEHILDLLFCNETLEEIEEEDNVEIISIEAKPNNKRKLNKNRRSNTPKVFTKKTPTQKTQQEVSEIFKNIINYSIIFKNYSN